MRYRWQQLTKYERTWQLTLEGTVTPKDIYFCTKNLVSYDWLLITAYDLESVHFGVLVQHFDGQSIPCTVLTDGLLVDGEWIDSVFTYSDFGKSQDSYRLIQGQRDGTNPLNIEVDYTAIPDLKITSESRKLLTDLLANLSRTVP